jgi:hypothetical protein
MRNIDSLMLIESAAPDLERLSLQSLFHGHFEI